MPSWIFVSSSCADAALQPRCGDCWCSFVAEGLDTCPTPPEGIADSFPPSFASFYQSFQLLNPNADLLTHRTADGTTDCYPFATTLGVLNRYPASSLPQCVFPESTPETVCGYVFNNDNGLCGGRSYQIITLENAQVAIADDTVVVVTHSGGT